MNNQARHLSLSLLVVASASITTADTLEWTNPVGGDFNDASRWTVMSGSNPPPPDAIDSINFNEAGA